MFGKNNNREIQRKVLKNWYGPIVLFNFELNVEPNLPNYFFQLLAIRKTPDDQQRSQKKWRT
jgi:hypothetical protein